MHLFDMNFGEKNHHLNLLCGANLSDDEFRIVMTEKQQKISNIILAVLQYQIVLPVNQIIIP